MTPRTLVLTHSRIAKERAERLFEGVDVELTVCGPGLGGARRAVEAVVRTRPELTYLIDIGISTTFGTVAAAAARSKVVVDTGDLAFELARSAGLRGPAGLATIWAGEKVMMKLADHVVVRGTAHIDMLDKPATFVPDLAPVNARPADGSRVRKELGLEGAFVVGLVGSLTWAPRLKIGYGWDLIEALAHTGPEVFALFLGRGDAREILERGARELGVAERCRFAGFVEPDELPEWIGAMDAGLSTQTNNAVGAVRTTSKLPLYLACGCPVLATDVGEARRVLGPLGWTIRYDGVVDRAYPARLATRIEEWRLDGAAGAARRREEALRVSRQEYDPTVVRGRLLEALGQLTSRTA